MFASPYPTFIPVTAPTNAESLHAGAQFTASYGGIDFQAIVPVGGCRTEEVFETIHPSVAPPKKTIHGMCNLHWFSWLLISLASGAVAAVVIYFVVENIAYILMS